MRIRGGFPTIGYSRAPSSPPGGDELGQQICVRNPGHPQRAPKCSAALRQCETCRIEVYVRTPARPSVIRVRHDPLIQSGDDPQQLGGWCATPATHTGAHRGRATYHSTSLPWLRRKRLAGSHVINGYSAAAVVGDSTGTTNAAPASADAACVGVCVTTSVSGLMSIRHPVSRAASRAFWPSRPMASESWKSGTVTRAVRVGWPDPPTSR